MGKTGRPSTISTHPDKVAIEQALARKVPLRKIATRWGVTQHAASRHRKKMREQNPKVFAAMVAEDWGVTVEQLEKLRVETAEGWLKQLRIEHSKLVAAQDAAIAEGTPAAVAAIAARVLQCLEMLGKATSNLSDHASRVTNIQNNIHLSPDFHRLRTRMLMALREYPDARRAVMEAMAADPVEDDGSPLIEHVPPVADAGAMVAA